MNPEHCDTARKTRCEVVDTNDKHSALELSGLTLRKAQTDWRKTEKKKKSKRNQEMRRVGKSWTKQRRAVSLSTTQKAWVRENCIANCDIQLPYITLTVKINQLFLKTFEENSEHKLRGNS